MQIYKYLNTKLFTSTSAGMYHNHNSAKGNAFNKAIFTTFKFCTMTMNALSLNKIQKILIEIYKTIKLLRLLYLCGVSIYLIALLKYLIK